MTTISHGDGSITSSKLIWNYVFEHKTIMRLIDSYMHIVLLFNWLLNKWEKLVCVQKFRTKWTTVNDLKISKSLEYIIKQVCSVRLGKNVLVRFKNLKSF